MAGHTKARVIPANLNHVTFECHPGLHQMMVPEKNFPALKNPYTNTENGLCGVSSKTEDEQLLMEGATPPITH